MAKTAQMAFSIDTSGFTKGLREASNSLKVAKATFEANTAGMTSWSKSADGVREKLKLLASQQEAYSKKTDLLKNQIQSISTLYEANAKKAEELRAKKEDLEKAGDTESEAYKKISKELKATETTMQSQQRTIEKHEQSLQMEELALTRVSNESTKWETELGNLESAEKSAETAGQDLAQGIDEIADHAESTGSSIGDTANAMQEMFTGAITKIAEVARACLDARQEIDAGYDTIAQGTGATGKNLDDLQEIADRVFTSMPNSMDDVSASLADINTFFGYTGDDLEECTTAFLKFQRVNGMSTESVGQLKKMMADAKIPLSDYQKTMDTLTTASQASGVSVNDLMTQVQQNGSTFRQLGMSTEDAIAYLATFSQQGVDTSKVLTGFKKAVANCASEGKNAGEEINKFMQGMADGSATAGDAIKLFGKGAGASIYQYAKEGKLNITDLQKVISQSAGQTEASYGEIADSMDDVTVVGNNLKSAGGKVGEVLLQKLEPLIDVVDKIAQAILSLDEDDLNKIGAGIEAIAVGLGGFAVGLVITKLVAGFTALTTAVQAAGGVWAFFNSILMANPIMLIATAIAGAIAAFVYFYNSSEEFRAFIDGLLKGIGDAIGGFIEWCKQAWQAVSEWWSGVVSWFSEVWQAVSNFFSGLWTGITEFFGSIGTKVGEFFSNLPQNLWNLIKKVEEFKLKVLQAVLNLGVNIVKKVIEFFGNIFNTVGQWLGNLIGKIGSFIGDIIGKVGSFASILVRKAQQAGKDFFNGIWNNIKNLPKKVLSLGGDIVKGIWDGISGMTDWLWDKIGGFASGIVDGFKDFLGIHSPSKVFSVEAQWIPAGIADGIHKASGQVYDELNALSNGMTKNFEVDLGTSANLGKDGIGSGYGSGAVIYNQTINSPKTLDLREIHRQSKNLLAFSTM